MDKIGSSKGDILFYKVDTFQDDYIAFDIKSFSTKGLIELNKIIGQMDKKKKKENSDLAFEFYFTVDKTEDLVQYFGTETCFGCVFGENDGNVDESPNQIYQIFSMKPVESPNESKLRFKIDRFKSKYAICTPVQTKEYISMKEKLEYNPMYFYEK